MTPFGQFLARPSTTILLNQMLADNARVDEQQQQPKDEPTGPRQCCADYASVIHCDGKVDWFECGVCSYQWFAPCGREVTDGF